MNSDPGFLNNPEAVFYGFPLQIRKRPLQSHNSLALALPAQSQDHDARKEAGRIRLPLLILQGGDDRLVDPAGARILFEGVASPDKQLIVYEGFYHEVFNEPEHDRVLSDVEGWLETRLVTGK